jgi:hypothetical protein
VARLRNRLWWLKIAGLWAVAPFLPVIAVGQAVGEYVREVLSDRRPEGGERG